MKGRHIVLALALVAAFFIARPAEAGGGVSISIGPYGFYAGPGYYHSYRPYYPRYYRPRYYYPRYYHSRRYYKRYYSRSWPRYRKYRRYRRW